MADVKLGEAAAGILPLHHALCDYRRVQRPDVDWYAVVRFASRRRETQGCVELLTQVR